MNPCLPMLVLVVLPTHAASIVANGHSEFTIVAASDATGPEQTAAKELQSFLIKDK